MAVRLERLSQRRDDVLAVGVGGHVGQVLGQRLAGDRHAVAVQQAGVEQRFHQRADAADLDQLAHQIAPAGFRDRPAPGRARRCA